MVKYFVKQFGRFLKGKIFIHHMIWPFYSWVPKINGSLYLYKDLHTNVHISFIYQYQKLETTQMSITNEWKNKPQYIHIMK